MHFFRGYAANCRVKREEEEKNLEKENANLRDQINVRKRQIHDDIRIIEQLEKKIKMAEDDIEEMKRSFNIQFGGRDTYSLCGNYRNLLKHFLDKKIS